jgi:hypothetical protein
MWTCAYCKIRNPDEEPNCLACGAPFTKPNRQVNPPQQEENLPQPVWVTAKSARDAAPEPESHPALKTAQKTAEVADQVYDLALTGYTYFWYAVADAIAIALCAFLLGIIGSATGMGFAGIFLSTLLGIVVGLTFKAHAYLHLFSAPVGLLLGAFFWLCPLFAFGAPPQGMLFIAGLLAIAAARVGHRERARKLPRWMAVRPFLGGAGGLLFALVGSGLGWLVQSALQALSW